MELSRRGNMSDLIILNVFHQAANDGIPSHWCVQFKNDDTGVYSQYKHFATWTEANEFAMSHGYND